MLSERASLQRLHELLQSPAYSRITRLAQHRRVEVYVVGGAVRDCLLGRPVTDVDFVVRGAELAELERWLKRIGRTILVGKRFGVFKVQMAPGEAPIDVALPRRDHALGRGGYHDVAVQTDPMLPIEDDLARRDFTVNALAYNVATGKIIDAHNGRTDLQARLVRAVGTPESRFAEDYSRVLRALRFAIELDFSIEPMTLGAMQLAAHRVGGTDSSGPLVPGTLIGKELGRAFAADGVRAFLMLQETRLLPVVLPEVAALKGIEQYKVFHPEGDALVHTGEALERLYADTSRERPSLTDVLTVLLHDVGKATRVQIKDLATGKRREIAKPHDYFKSAEYDPKRQRVMNIGHSEASVAIARKICKRWSLNQFARPPFNFDQAELEHNIEFHLLQNIGEMRPSKAERILFYPNGRVRWSLLRLVRADAGDRIVASGAGSRRTRYQTALDRIHQLLGQKISGVAHPESQSKLAPVLITGADLIELGAEPGPRFAAILAAIRDAQLAGRISDQAAARKLAKDFLRNIALSKRAN